MVSPAIHLNFKLSKNDLKMQKILMINFGWETFPQKLYPTETNWIGFEMLLTVANL